MKEIKLENTSVFQNYDLFFAITFCKSKEYIT